MARIPSQQIDSDRSAPLSHASLPGFLGCKLCTPAGTDSEGRLVFKPIYEGCKNCCAVPSLRALTGCPGRFAEMALEVLQPNKMFWNGKTVFDPHMLEKYVSMTGQGYRFIIFYGDASSLEPEELRFIIDFFNDCSAKHELLLPTKSPRQLRRILQVATEDWTIACDKILLGVSIVSAKPRELKKVRDLLSIEGFKKEIWLSPLLGSPHGLGEYLRHPDIVRVKAALEVGTANGARRTQQKNINYARRLADSAGKEFVETKVYEKEENNLRSATCFRHKGYKTYKGE